jgi:hypothetical protein
MVNLDAPKVILAIAEHGNFSETGRHFYLPRFAVRSVTIGIGAGVEISVERMY